MAGKVLRKKVLKQLDAEGGPEVFFDRIANGETITSLSPEYGCSRNYLARTIDSQPEYAKMLAKARQASADALVEGGFEMVEKLGATSSSTEMPRAMKLDRMMTVINGGGAPPAPARG